MPARATESAAGKRRYRWKGREYPSVTTILNVIAKPALVPWAAKVTAEFAVENLDEVARRKEADPDDAVSYLKGAQWKAKNKAGLKGTEIHALAEAYSTGAPLPPVSPGAVPYVTSLTDFLKDHRPEPLLTEKTVFNVEKRYAGTFDGIADFPEFGRCIFDWKTSRGVYGETALQLNAYAYGEFWDDGESGECLPKLDGALVVHLAPTGYAIYRVPIRDDIFDAFLGACKMANFAEEISPHVLTAL